MTASAPTAVPAARIAPRNDRPPRPQAQHVLYWMTAARRTRCNFALQRAVEWARRLDRPLLVLEALRCDSPWASDRFHRFVLDGMAAQVERFADSPVTYLPFVERRVGEGRGLLAALAREAAVVIADDAPIFFLPRMLATAAARLEVLCEAVDGNGLLPLSVHRRTWPTAYAFRRFVQRELPLHLGGFAQEDPLEGVELPRLAELPAEVQRRWPAASPDWLGAAPVETTRTPQQIAAASAALAELPVDHSVGVVATAGGERAAQAALQTFVRERLPRYLDERRRADPEDETTSGLSPWLHFGHVSAQAVFTAVAERADWTPAALGSRRDGRREGFWGLDAASEAFLDQLVTWRELGLNSARLRDDDEAFESLPEWARATLGRHADDPRDPLYSREELRTAATHDPVWNAAQQELLQTGRMHNHLRMLWGKKILEWSPDPASAVATMFELNHRYALDGRDPNSASGILWCCGRYDRPWGPERPIFGTIRYMSSANTARKLKLKSYLARYGAGAPAVDGDATDSLFPG